MCRTRNTDLVSTVMCTTSVFQLWKSCSSPCLPDWFFFFLYSADVVDTEVHLKNIYNHSFKTNGVYTNITKA